MTVRDSSLMGVRRGKHEPCRVPASRELEKVDANKKQTPHSERKMPVKKQDTERALLLLQDYCSKLKKPEERQLKIAVERVINIFRSGLFQALLGMFQDIRNFYIYFDDTHVIWSSQKCYFGKFPDFTVCLRN